MKFIIVLAFLIAAVSASPYRWKDAKEWGILRYEEHQDQNGYKFGIETADGKKHDEEGQLKNVGTDQEAISVKGSFEFVSDDGQKYTVNYIADENGFQPVGAHLPVAPTA